MKQSTINAIGIMALLFWALPSVFFGYFFGLAFMLLTLIKILFGADEIKAIYKK